MFVALQNIPENTMAFLSLKISLEGGTVTKTIQFDPQTTVFDACKIIRDKFSEAVHGQRKLFTRIYKNNESTTLPP